MSDEREDVEAQHDAASVGHLALSTPGFALVPGMLLRTPLTVGGDGDIAGRVAAVWPNGTVLIAIPGAARLIGAQPSAWPDLEDGATLGALLDLVADRAWDGAGGSESVVADAEAWVQPAKTGWTAKVRAGKTIKQRTAETRGEAALALLADVVGVPEDDAA